MTYKEMIDEAVHDTEEVTERGDDRNGKMRKLFLYGPCEAGHIVFALKKNRICRVKITHANIHPVWQKWNTSYFFNEQEAENALAEIREIRAVTDSAERRRRMRDWKRKRLWTEFSWGLGSLCTEPEKEE